MFVDDGFSVLDTCGIMAQSSNKAQEVQVEKVDINKIVQEKNNGQPIKVVANLPYYITTPIIMHLLENIPEIKRYSVMVQLEVADRIVANKGGKDYNNLTIAIGYRAKTYKAINVSRNVFMPKPNVDSAVVIFDIYENNAYDIEGLSKKVNCDCSALVMTCCRAAGITVSKNMITATEDADLMNTGAFIKYTTPLMLTRGNGLKRGDILLRVGHTAIVTEGFNEPIKPKKVLKIARFFDRGRAGSYKTTCSCNLRYGASLTDTIRKVLPAGATVYNYGYYNTDDRGVVWLLVIAGADVGYVSRKVLTR